MRTLPKHTSSKICLAMAAPPPTTRDGKYRPGPPERTDSGHRVANLVLQLRNSFHAQHRDPDCLDSKVVFPQAQRPDTPLAQRPHCGPIALCGACQLGTPIARVVARHAAMFWTAVPETSVREDRQLQAREVVIGAAR